MFHYGQERWVFEFDDETGTQAQFQNNLIAQLRLHHSRTQIEQDDECTADHQGYDES